MVTKGFNVPPNCGRFACGSGSGHHRGCGTGGNVGPGAWAHAESLEGAERERLERVVSGIDRYGCGGHGRGGGGRTAAGTITTITSTAASGFGGGGGAETTTTGGGGAATGGATPGGRGNLSLTRRRRLIHARQHATGGTTTTEGDAGALVGPLIRVRPLTSEYGEAVQIGAAIGEEDEEVDEEGLDERGDGDDDDDDDEDLDDGT